MRKTPSLTYKFDFIIIYVCVTSFLPNHAILYIIYVYYRSLLILQIQILRFLKLWHIIKKATLVMVLCVQKWC